jgi:trimethylamine--corrinoid protein Co-methyltransferase
MGLRRKKRDREAVQASGLALPSLTTSGGRLSVLAATDLQRIHEAALHLLAEFGMSDAPAGVQKLVCEAGGQRKPDGRLAFPAEVVSRALAGIRRDITLFGRQPVYDLTLGETAVHVGSGGAAPMIFDTDTKLYRAATLADLYDAARLVDALPHVQFFARSLVARDMENDRLLDLNTSYAALAGTTKHVFVSAACAAHVDDIVTMCHIVAGGSEAFAARPFLSLNINHVAPPMRFSPDAAEVLVAASRAGLPCMVNTFGQLGASSPVTVAGCLAQSHAETLAGMVVAWLANPNVCAVYGARPMVTDLRSGGMAGGSGEQALLTAAATQLARFLNLPNSTIAGATDSKLPDAQAGYEKALSITMAAQAGANLITQGAGMQAGLMGASMEAYVIDNDMLGAIRRSLSPIEVSSETLCPEMIERTIRSEGHFLGHPQTYDRMKTDFLYPGVADRKSIDAWQADGGHDIRAQARVTADRILATHYPQALNPSVDAVLRGRFDIRLPLSRMSGS